MTPETWTYVVVGIVIVLVGWTVYQNRQAGKPLTVEEIIKAGKASYPIALRVKEVAEMAVFATEEFGRTNDIPMPSDEKLRTAINIFRRWIPLEEVDDVAMLEAIHSFIPKINALTPPKGNVLFTSKGGTP